MPLFLASFNRAWDPRYHPGGAQHRAGPLPAVPSLSWSPFLQPTGHQRGARGPERPSEQPELTQHGGCRGSSEPSEARPRSQKHPVSQKHSLSGGRPASQREEMLLRFCPLRFTLEHLSWRGACWAFSQQTLNGAAPWGGLCVGVVVVCLLVCLAIKEAFSARRGGAGENQACASARLHFYQMTQGGNQAAFKHAPSGNTVA